MTDSLNFPVHPRTSQPPLPEGVSHMGSVKIQRPREEVYDFFRELENLPRFMMHVHEVTELDGGRSHWVVDGPGNTRVEWDAQITEERPGELLAWESLPGSDVSHCGIVQFYPATGGRGTVVRVALDYSPPGGKIGQLTAKVTGRSPGQEIPDDLRRLKAILEAGESAEVVGQTRGKRSLLGKMISPNT